jgi:hypothetical protein
MSEEVNEEVSEETVNRFALIDEARRLSSELADAEIEVRRLDAALGEARGRKSSLAVRLQQVSALLAEIGETIEAVVPSTGDVMNYPQCAREIAFFLESQEGKQAQINTIVEHVKGYKRNSIRAALGAMKRAGLADPYQYGWWRLLVAAESVGLATGKSRKHNEAADWVTETMRLSGDEAMGVQTLIAMAPDHLKGKVENAAKGLITRSVLMRNARGMYSFRKLSFTDSEAE